MLIPSTDDEVTKVYMAVRRRKPAFPGFAYGYLYATESKKRRVVAIPYDFGVKKIRSVSELFIQAWIPPRGPMRNIVDTDKGRVHVTHFPPDSLTALEFSYSIFYVVPYLSGETPINHCGSLRSAFPWKGNVLVVKHGKRKAVINMDREDALLVDNIVQTYIDKKMLQ